MWKGEEVAQILWVYRRVCHAIAFSTRNLLFYHRNLPHSSSIPIHIHNDEKRLRHAQMRSSNLKRVIRIIYTQNKYLYKTINSASRNDYFHHSLIKKKSKTAIGRMNIKSYRFIDSDRFSEEIEGGREGEQDKEEVYIDHGTLIMEVMKWPYNPVCLRLRQMGSRNKHSPGVAASGPKYPVWTGLEKAWFVLELFSNKYFINSNYLAHPSTLKNKLKIFNP